MNILRTVIPDPESLLGRLDPASGLIGEAGTRTRLSLELAIGLLRNGKPDAAAQSIDAVLALQCADPDAYAYGQFPLNLGPWDYQDLNIILFLLPHLLELEVAHAATLPSATRARLATALDRAGDAVLRRWDEEVFDLHRDHVCYTNVALLQIRSLVLLGRYRQQPRLLRVAAGQWRRWFTHAAYFGIDEFLSPTYAEVDREALDDILLHAEDPRMLIEARVVLDHILAEQAAVLHPVLGLPLCGSSRHHRGFIQPGPMAGGHAGPPVPAISTAHDFPYRATGRAGLIPFRWRTWQLATAGLGSMSGGHVFWQQIHAIAAVGTDAWHRAVAWFPGRCTNTPGWTDQRDGDVLCLFHRGITSMHGTQWCVPRSQAAEPLGEHGLGIIGSWLERHEASRLILSAHDWNLVVDTWADGAPAPLHRQDCTSTGQAGTHGSTTTFAEWTFPNHATWFAARMRLVSASAPLPALPAWRWSTDGHGVSLADGDRVVEVKVLPHGEAVSSEGLRRDEPLLQTPELRVLPGSWLRLWPEKTL